MTTIRQIITDTFREAGILATGEEPDADQLDEALRRLNTLYKSLFGAELGEPLLPVNYGTQGLTNSFALDEDQASEINSTYVPSNSRLIFNIGSAVTLYLPPKPMDGARFGVIDNSGNLATYNVTVDANGRKIESASTLTLNTNSLNREWFYRADLAEWKRVADLLVGDESPLPAEFDDFLVTLLAFRLNPRYGAETDQNMIEILKRMRRLFRARYRQVTEMPSEAALYRLTTHKTYAFKDDFPRG